MDLSLFAGLFEVAWAIGLKYTAGFSRIVPSLLIIAAMAISLALLGLALKSLPVGTAYAIWTGFAQSAPRRLASICSANLRPLCVSFALG